MKSMRVMIEVTLYPLVTCPGELTESVDVDAKERSRCMYVRRWLHSNERHESKASTTAFMYEPSAEWLGLLDINSNSYAHTITYARA
jgi:hypothetical protein